MSYLLFMDESGHDHKSLPYEVRGGVCLRDNTVGAFTDDLKRLELNCFGDHLRNYGSEIKAVKLLRKDRFEWAGYEPRIPAQERRKLCRQFLATTARGNRPTRRGFCAYGQASQAFVRLLFASLKDHEAKVFASMIPKGMGRRPQDSNPDLVRKDITFLFERFYYFLEERKEMGMIVMDETDRADDRRFMRKLERYFVAHERGREHASLIIPTPFFVGSDMSYPVQAADVVIHCIAQSYRVPKIGIDAEPRAEVASLVGDRIKPLVSSFMRESDDSSFYRSDSIFLVADPWREREKKVSQTGAVFRAPRKTNLHP